MLLNAARYQLRYTPIFHAPFIGALLLYMIKAGVSTVSRKNFRKYRNISR